MKSICTLIVAVAILIQPVQALCQKVALTPIRSQRGLLGYSYYSGDKKLDSSHLEKLLQNEPNAKMKYSFAKRQSVIAKLFGAAGGLMVGIPVGQSIGGKDDPEWTVAYVGGGLLLTGIIFEISHQRSTQSAVEMYNRKILPTNDISLSGNTVRFRIQPNSVALVFNF